MTTTLFSVMAQSQATNLTVLEPGVTSLSQLAAALAAREAKLKEVLLTPEKLHFNEEGLLLQGRAFKINEDVRRRLYKKVHAPHSYLKNFSLRFQSEALTEHAMRGNFGTRPIAVFDNDELITIAKGDEGLVNLAGSQVIGAIAQELGREG